MTGLKKVLIVSSWAPPMPGGPQNMFNIFSQFPRDSFAIITSYRVAPATDHHDVGTQWLPCTYYYFDKKETASKLHEEILKQKKTIQSMLVGFVRHIPYVGPRISGVLTTVSLILRYTNATVASAHASGAKCLIGVSDKGPALISTYLTHRRTRLPYVIHLYDLYCGNNITGFLGFLARWLERPILTNAHLVILTNEGTERYYKKRYGETIRTVVLHNATFAEEYEKVRTPFKPNPPYTIIFTGHVYWPQEGAVLNMIRAMDLLNDLPVTLQLYIPSPAISIIQAVEGKTNITLSTAAQHEMPRIQNSATLLFLPFAWNTPSPDIIATATPGKFTDYLASGRPMLVHAPDYSYVAKYVRKHNLGLVVDQNDVHLLAETIRDFLENPSIASLFIKRSLEIFQKEYTATINSKIMMKLLNNI